VVALEFAKDRRILFATDIIPVHDRVILVGCPSFLFQHCQVFEGLIRRR
jgi:hypothetical protein